MELVKGLARTFTFLCVIFLIRLPEDQLISIQAGVYSLLLGLGSFVGWVDPDNI